LFLFSKTYRGVAEMCRGLPPKKSLDCCLDFRAIVGQLSTLDGIVMRTPQQINSSQRFCGWFFIFLSVLSLALSGLHFYLGRWGLAALLLPGVLFGGVVGRLAIAGASRSSRVSGGSDGLSGAGKPVPVSPAPTHHLQAAKDLPPSDKTHSLPKD